LLLLEGLHPILSSSPYLNLKAYNFSKKDTTTSTSQS